MTPDHLTGKDLNGLSVHELKNLLNKQVGNQRRQQDRLNEIKAELSVANTNIRNIRARINRLSAADTPVEVCDHAILRYLQRVCGIDLEAVTDVLDTPELRECVQRCPTGRHTINGVTYVTRDKALVTVIYDDDPRPDAPLPIAEGES